MDNWHGSMTEYADIHKSSSIHIDIPRDRRRSFWYFLVVCCLITGSSWSPGPRPWWCWPLSQALASDPRWASEDRRFDAQWWEVFVQGSNILLLTHLDVGVSINGGTPKMMVYIRKSHLNGWVGGTPIPGNLHVIVLYCLVQWKRSRC